MQHVRCNRSEATFPACLQPLTPHHRPSLAVRHLVTLVSKVLGLLSMAFSCKLTVNRLLVFK